MRNDFNSKTSREERYIFPDVQTGALCPTEEAIKACRRSGKLARMMNPVADRTLERKKVLKGVLNQIMGIEGRKEGELSVTAGLVNVIKHLAKETGKELPRIEGMPASWAKADCYDKTPLSLDQSSLFLDTISRRFFEKPYVLSAVQKRLDNFAKLQERVNNSHGANFAG